jgi:hypothetical protein
MMGHAQDQPENAIVHTPGGKVNVVAKFTGTSVIGDSAISESGGNVKVTGKITAGGTVSGSDISTSGTVSGTSGSFTSTVNAGSYNLNGIAFAYGSGSEGNAFLGFAGNTTTTGTDNTATGAGALQSDTSGAGIVAYGQAALVNNSAGNDNAAFGTNALFNNTTGSFNTAIGVDALEASNGSDLTCIGYNCSASRDELQNATAIGAHAMVTVSDAVVLGSVAGVNGATATARVGIGTTNPTNLLTLGQGFGPSISDGWTTYSSRRWKNNIQPLNNALGMVEQLRGVSYDLKDSGKHEIGVIAEEVGEVVPEVVSYEQNGKDARGVDYSRLTALLIEAVKQQQQQIKTQQLQIARLNGKVGVLAATLRTVQHPGESPVTVRSSASKTHGLPSQQAKSMGHQGN